ncbi:MAG: flagellar hook-basal body complex protein FliE [Deltaproteobacteria bacterium]|nr:flagellar hook-basal body complex protein FliE [Deltaproteobacteria bacterium]MCB9787790.1 flagellar hook-basal body complex protein FliE [Deltaproteobacteria bacterium]
MEISAISPHLPLGETQALRAPVGTESPVGGARDPVADFADALGKALDETNATVAHGDEVVERFVGGEDVPVHQVMVALAESGIAMQLTAAVTTRAISAYQEIARMQI